MVFFTEIEKTILKFAWNHKWLQIAKVILRKNKARGIHTLRFQTWLQSCSNQYSTGIKNGLIDQGNRIQSLETNPYIYGQLICDKRVENIKQSFQSMVLGKLYNPMQKSETGSYIIHKNLLKMD